MQRRGLVRAERATDDRRVRRFELSPDGLALYRRIAPTMAARKALLDGCLAPSDLADFLDSARTVTRAAAIRTGRQQSVGRSGIAQADPMPVHGTGT